MNEIEIIIRNHAIFIMLYLYSFYCPRFKENEYSHAIVTFQSTYSCISYILHNIIKE